MLGPERAGDRSIAGRLRVDARDRRRERVAEEHRRTTAALRTGPVTIGLLITLRDERHGGAGGRNQHHGQIASESVGDPSAHGTYGGHCAGLHLLSVRWHLHE